MSVWVGAGWKMNKTHQEALAYADAIFDAVPENIDAFVLPPFTCLAAVAERLAESHVKVGAQNIHWEDHGPWTGEISGPMLRDCGATLVEIGHSERRAHFGENCETVALRVDAALRHGLTPLICVGETAEDLEQGRADAVIEHQVRTALAGAQGGDVMIAYEPVWAVGEGGTAATPQDVETRQATLAALALDMIGRPVPVLYGGSVSQSNASGLLACPSVDGLFVGRAAWSADGFLALANVAASHAKNEGAS
ncbi:MAG: triose-phosphate isomerase [Pseudomonadota bacterium]